MNTMIFPAKLRLTDPAALPAAGKAVGEVQSALLRLKVSVSARDLARKELGASTVEAVRRFQERAGLPADGRLTRATAAKLNAEVAHSFVVESKTRTQRVQDWLQEAGQNIAAEETRSRKFGPTTERAYKQFQAKLGVAQDGRITEDIVRRLREEALKTRLGSKTQVAQVHRTLLRALNIAKLKDVRVDASELKSRKIGASTQAAIKAVQTKYGLPVTGELNAATHDRLVSIASSIPQPVKHLKARAAVDLRPVERVLRLNTTHSQVNTAQGALAFLGYAIEQREFASRTFGRSTREAVLKYQRDHGLPQTGHIEGATLDSLNREVQQANPQAGGTEPRYHVRGAVRDERWRGMAGLKVQVWERLIGRQGAMLAERKTAGNGFFDIPYDPPREAATGQIKVPFAIEVRVLNANIKGPGGTPVAHPQKVLFNPTPIAWVNFTEGDQPYRGTSEWEVRTAVVAKAIQPGNIADLVETGQKPQKIGRAHV